MNAIDESARMEDLLRYAALAPSRRTAQPWQSAIVPQGIEIFAGGNDRDSLMSAGGAITCLRVAAAHFGFDSRVLYPRATDATPAALVALKATLSPDPSLVRLFPAIAGQHTNRAPFDGVPIDPQPLSDLCDLLDAHAASLRLVLPRDWPRVTEMARGDERHREDLVSSASMLMVLTAADDAVSLLKAGELAERLLLTVTLAGLDYAFLNQVVDASAPRDALRALLHSSRPPQLLLLIGHARRFNNARARDAAASLRTTHSRPDSVAAAR